MNINILKILLNKIFIIFKSKNTLMEKNLLFNFI